jgi:hypothetical protein
VLIVSVAPRMLLARPKKLGHKPVAHGAQTPRCSTFSEKESIFDTIGSQSQARREEMKHWDWRQHVRI